MVKEICGRNQAAFLSHLQSRMRKVVMKRELHEHEKLFSCIHWSLSSARDRSSESLLLIPSPGTACDGESMWSRGLCHSLFCSRRLRSSTAKTSSQVKD